MLDDIIIVTKDCIVSLNHNPNLLKATQSLWHLDGVQVALIESKLVLTQRIQDQVVIITSSNDDEHVMMSALREIQQLAEINQLSLFTIQSSGHYNPETLMNRSKLRPY